MFIDMKQSKEPKPHENSCVFEILIAESNRISYGT